MLDGDRLAAVAVLHDAVGKSEHVLRVAVAGAAAAPGRAGRGGRVVEGHVADARRVLGAGAVVVTAAAAAATSGRGSRRGSGRGLLRRRRRSNGGSGRGSLLGGGAGARFGPQSRLLRGRRRNGSGRGSHRRVDGSVVGGLLSRLGLSDRDSGGGGLDNSRSGQGGVVAVDIDGGGDIDGGPFDIGDGFPHDDILAFLHGSSGGGDREESASQGKSLGDGSHFKESWLIGWLVGLRRLEGM